MMKIAAGLRIGFVLIIASVAATAEISQSENIRERR